MQQLISITNKPQVNTYAPKQNSTTLSGLEIIVKTPTPTASNPNMKVTRLHISKIEKIIGSVDIGPSNQINNQFFVQKSENFIPLTIIHIPLIYVFSPNLCLSILG
jgi:hypothetical protein